MTAFVIAPQWQGSPAARALLLADGAEAIAGDLPRARTVRVDVAHEAGDSLGTGVRRLSAIMRTREAIREALTDEATVVVGGDCSVALPGIEHVARDRRIALVWFDAHADLHVPETSASHAYSGMALRAALGDGEGALTGAASPDRTFLVGARSIDEAEAGFLADSSIRVFPTGEVTDSAELVRAVAESGADALYVHVDLDVLDPAAITGVSDAVPFGLNVSTLTGAIAALRQVLPLVGASLTGFAPSTPAAAVDDLGGILRIVGALA